MYAKIAASKVCASDLSAMAVAWRPDSESEYTW